MGRAGSAPVPALISGWVRLGPRTGSSGAASAGRTQGAASPWRARVTHWEVPQHPQPLGSPLKEAGSSPLTVGEDTGVGYGTGPWKRDPTKTGLLCTCSPQHAKMATLAA